NATCDWIIFLDCDEELAPESGPALRKAIEDSSYEAYFVLVRNMIEMNIELTFPSIRLFKNREYFRFEGRIHEQIVNSIIRNFEQKAIGYTGITIIHHGYNTGTTNVAAKVQRNLEILKGYPEERRDGFFYYNLGTEHLRLGDRKEALKYYLEALKLTKPTQAYGPILVKRTMTTLMDLKRYRDAIEQLRYYHNIYKDFSDLCLLEAVCLFNCGRHSEAGTRLQDYLEMPPPPAWYPSESTFHETSADDLVNRVKALSVERGCPGLSVCVIGRDEEGLVEHCIRSVNEIAQEVIFVDTGSVDKTPAVAYQMGASIYRFPWNADFSEARNFAIEKVSSDWILVLDADEALPDQSRKMIVDLISEAGFEGYFLKICTFLDGGLSPANCQITRACRLFRNKNHRFRGAVLEDIVPSIVDSGGKTAFADITINHFHCLAGAEPIARKRQRKVEAIEKGLAADTARQNLALGIEAFYAQDFTKAIGYLENCPEGLDAANVPDFFYFYALSLLRTDDYRRAACVLYEAVKCFPDYTDLVYSLAVARFALGEIVTAEELLEHCLEMGDASWEKYTASPGTGGFKAMCSLGTICARKGETHRALELFIEAARIPAGFEQAVENIVFLKDMLPSPVEHYLESNGLLNSRSLGIIAGTLAKMGRFEESLHYLTLAGELIAQEPAPRNFKNITGAIDLLVGKFHWQASKSLPEDSSFKSLLVV
ncbi:MAG: glycosyltransferase, partial [Bacillota bacterium]